ERMTVKEPGKFTLTIYNKYVDDVICVSEPEIADAMIYLLERSKSLVEGAGAAALACLLSHYDTIDSEKTGVVVSGGNIDISKMPVIQSLASEFHKKQGLAKRDDD